MIKIIPLLILIIGILCTFVCDQPISVSDINITALLTDTTITAGDTISINAANAKGLLISSALNYNWSSEPQAYLSDSTKQIVQFCAQSMGTYVVKLTISGAGNEIVHGKAIITVLPKPPLVAAILLSDTTISYNGKQYINVVLCRHDTVFIIKYDTVHDTTRISYPVHDTVKLQGAQNSGNPDSVLQYRWFSLDSGLVIENDTGHVTHVTTSKPGNYAIRLVVSDNRGTRDSTTIHIEFASTITPPKPLLNLRCIYNRRTDSLKLLWKPSSTPNADSVGFVWRTDGTCQDTFSRGFTGLVLNSAESTVVSVPHINSNAGLCVSAFVHDQLNHWSDPATATISIVVDTVISVVIQKDTIKEAVHDTLHDTIKVVRVDTVRTTKTDTLIITAYDTVRITLHDTITVPVHDTTRITITISPQNVAPRNVTNLSVVLQPDSSLEVKWLPSPSSDAESTAVCYRTDGNFPQNPTDGTTHIYPSADSLCVLAYNKNRQTIFIGAFVKDSSGQWSSASKTAQAIYSYPPIANPGRDTTYFWMEKIDSLLYLDASASWFAPNTEHHFMWTNAANNPVMINLEQIERPSFQTPIPGKYGFILQTFDGSQYSSPMQVVITIWKPIFVSHRVSYSWALDSISKGVVNANEGDTVYIDNGTYPENVIINKSKITLKGKQRDSVIIKGGFSASTFTIKQASFVTLMNLRITQGAPLKNCAGVKCTTSSYVTLENLLIDSNNTDGIRFFNSSPINIINSSIQNNQYSAIRAWGSTFTASGCSFSSNCMKNGINSIIVPSISLDSIASTMELSGNLFTNCQAQQIRVLYSSTVMIHNNQFDNVSEGIYCAPNCQATITMHDNNFAKMNEYCLWCDGTTLTTISSQRDTMESWTTPMWCNGAINISIMNDRIVNRSPVKDINQKGIDLGGCEIGEIAQNQIHGFAVGIIVNTSPVDIWGNIFTNDSIGICIQSTADTAKYPHLEKGNNFSGCAIDTGINCLGQ